MNDILIDTNPEDLYMDSEAEELEYSMKDVLLNNGEDIDMIAGIKDEDDCEYCGDINDDLDEYDDGDYIEYEEPDEDEIIDDELDKNNLDDDDLDEIEDSIYDDYDEEDFY